MCHSYGPVILMVLLTTQVFGLAYKLTRILTNPRRSIFRLLAEVFNRSQEYGLIPNELIAPGRFRICENVGEPTHFECFYKLF